MLSKVEKLQNNLRMSYLSFHLINEANCCSEKSHPELNLYLLEIVSHNPVSHFHPRVFKFVLLDPLKLVQGKDFFVKNIRLIRFDPL